MTITTIETFLGFQRSDGFIPYRVMRSHSDPFKYLGRPTYLPKPRANFYSHQSGGLIPDGGLVVIIAAGELLNHSKKDTHFKKWYPQLTKALEWYITQFGEGAHIREWFLSEWADAVLKVGHTLYTNIVYIQALTVLWRVAVLMRDREGEERYTRLLQMTTDTLQSALWNGRYFSDWIDWKRHEYFASHPNMLAILFNVASTAQARKILSYAKTCAINTFTLETNVPAYPFWRIPLHHYLVGMADYHNHGCLWFQPGILYAVSLWKVGKRTEAKNALQKISQQIVRFGQVYEVYERSGFPLSRWSYSSERPFAWSAGLYLWAYYTIYKG